ncbi:MAG: hypothetical protein IAF08_14130 [Rhizobacter sp.]|nr:hypothetical protein [Chlorobiales bacterium]
MMPSVNPVADEDEFVDDDDFYRGPFKPQTGISGTLGITNTGFYGAFNYMRQLSPDLTGSLTLSFTAGRDENEQEKFDIFTGQTYITDQFGNPKINDLWILPFTAGLQYRLFRREIVSSFRPFVEIGAGPTLGYVTDYYSGFFGGFSKGYATLGMNGYIGIGSFFGADNAIQGITIRYQFNAFAQGVEVLQNTPKQFFGSISLNLIFGTFF